MGSNPTPSADMIRQDRDNNKFTIDDPGGGDPIEFQVYVPKDLTIESPCLLEMWLDGELLWAFTLEEVDAIARISGQMIGRELRRRIEDDLSD